MVPLSVVASLTLPAIAILIWRSGRRRAAMLPALLFIALVGNAAICGVVAGQNDRYQARLAWLAPLAIGLAGWSLVGCREKGPPWAYPPIFGGGRRQSISEVDPNNIIPAFD